MIVHADDDRYTGSEHLGGKGAALHALSRAGFRVPAFFVITPAAFDDEGRLLPDIVTALPAALARLDDAAINDTATTNRTRSSGQLRFAVRSSASAEDGLASSFAGQLRSFLDIAPADVAGRAEDVWQSARCASVDAYRQQASEVGRSSHAATPSALSIPSGSSTPTKAVTDSAGNATMATAVVVQRMVDAQVSGVAFSADPLDGRRDRRVITATRGLGDSLVAGEVDGQTWRLDADGAVVQRPDSEDGTQDGTQNGTRDGTQEGARITAQHGTDNNREHGKAALLSDAALAELAALLARCEATFGVPQDIEWACDEHGLYLLQSRPITTALRPPANLADDVGVFDNANIVESYPGLVSPLTYSFAVYVYARVYRAFVRLLGVGERRIASHADVFDNMLARVDGRVYYNLVSWYRALAMLPGFARNREHMETMMGVDEPLPASLVAAMETPSATLSARLLDHLRMAGVALRLLFEAARLPLTRKGFLTRLERALHSNIDFAAASPAALVGEYRFIERELLDRWDAPLVNDFLCMLGFGLSRKWLERDLGMAGLELHNEILVGQGDILSAEPARRITAMGAWLREHDQIEAFRAWSSSSAVGERFPQAALQRQIDAYLERFGDRCTEELKLESIPLTDDPASLYASIIASARRPTVKRPPATEVDWTRHYPGRPVRRWLVSWLMRWTGARVRDRENLRFERTRIFGHARRVFLALGREFAARDRLEHERDVFHLSRDEVLGAVEGNALDQDLKSLVAVRKAAMAAAAAREDPPARIVFADLPPMTTARQPQQRTEQDHERRRHGTPCSAGRVQARARVIRDPRSEHLAPGEILVARHTDPGWIAVFSNAAALVVERGSLLSHSAIVARELGIPCVVALKGATRWIESGEMLDVDGATGEVVRLDKDGEEAGISADAAGGAGNHSSSGETGGIDARHAIDGVEHHGHRN